LVSSDVLLTWNSVARELLQPARSDALRQFQEVAITFCDADLLDPAYSETKGELFCIT
jgi:hypothetical protein